jgi:hypothetical protein
LVEITDDRGAMLDVIQVTEPRLKLIAKHSASGGEAKLTPDGAETLSSGSD